MGEISPWRSVLYSYIRFLSWIVRIFQKIIAHYEFEDKKQSVGQERDTAFVIFTNLKNKNRYTAYYRAGSLL